MSVHTRMHKLLRNAHYCACPQPHPSVRIHLAHGVFLAPPRTDPCHPIGGLAGSWLLLALSLTWLQGIPLCLAETWCSILFSLILLSMCVRSPSWVYPLNVYAGLVAPSPRGMPLASS